MKIISYLIILLSLFSCSSSDVKDAIDIIDGLPRKEIDSSLLGVSAFVNDSRFGAIEAQFAEVKSTLGISFVRILFAWNDQVQSSSDSAPDFSFYDDIAAGIPDGVDALVVLTGLPSWMSDSQQWLGGNPRTTFVERWARRVMRRYGGNPRIIGWQIWNEPNDFENADNTTLSLVSSPDNYVEMVASARAVSDDIAPSKYVVNAATTSINQDYPATRNYNRALRDAGIEEFIDAYAVHYYGSNYENVIRDGGIADFLNSLVRPVWITESGERGVNNQLAYVEQTWPFLKEQIPGIERIYYYQFTDTEPATLTFGLRNLDSAFPVSDLYVYLRDK